ncbi:MAG: sn-glycerol-3-phosphate ABC transporter ATP-binding protein UgpC [Alphaproteobacteria bacterium]
MSGLKLNDVVKRFQSVEVIHGVSFDIADGEFCVFVGPSGCGKSTLLRMVAGLEDITGGTIAIGERVVNGVDPSERGIAMVFQSYALYPHMTVEQNMGFGLRMAKMPKDEIKKRVDNAARILQLDHLLERTPKALSGGQRQRVAIGRAIVRNPGVFLFDEPLSNLDAELRVQMRVEIAKLHQDLGATMIYVTHDQVEAMTLADKIVVLRSGHVEQIGAPLDLYNDPDNQFVAGFIGSPKMNFLNGKVESIEGQIATVSLTDQGGARLQLAVRNAPAPGMPIQLGIRPEHVAIANGAPFAIELHADVTEQLGGSSYVYAKSPAGEPLVVEQRGHSPVKTGDKVAFTFDPDQAFLFTEKGARIR